METHSIRLRGPWLLTPLAPSTSQGDVRSNEVPATVIQQLPADWRAVLGEKFFGTVAYERSFGLPTNLAPSEQVRLVYDYPPGQTPEFMKLNCWLNGELLLCERGGAGYAWDVTAKLSTRNTLRLEVTQMPIPIEQKSEGDARGLAGLVRLEICAGGT